MSVHMCMCVCLCVYRRHELEKKALNDQLARTMQLFQEQLANTIKMAAMLQVQTHTHTHTRPCAWFTKSTPPYRLHATCHKGRQTQGHYFGKPFSDHRACLCVCVCVCHNPQAQRIMTGAPAQDAPTLPQVPLPQEVDEPPTEDEIRDYGR